MEAVELKKKINKIVQGIEDKNFLINLYDLLQNKANDKSEADILDELDPKQMARLKSAMKELETGKGIPNRQAIERLRKLAR